VVVQGDGKIVVAGSSYNGFNNDFALALYNANGTLDTLFDSDGRLTSNFGGSNDYGRSVAVQSDGKIVVAGYIYTGSSDEFGLARYNANGTLDTSFDGDGRARTAIGRASSVAVQGDGKIVVAGFNSVDFALARYNANGTLDMSFDGDGTLATDFGASDGGRSVAVQSDGKIVVAGTSFGDFALARYNGNGTLDTSFDGDGKLTTGFGLSDDYVNGVALQSDGKIVVAGYSDSGSRNDFALARYEGVSTPPTLVGDYNQNNVVDAGDFVLWRKTLGNAVANYSGADGDGDGMVDQDDLAVWKANFGNTLGAGAEE
jgi:uncharacterized delta-60 repeat protein